MPEVGPRVRYMSRADAGSLHIGVAIAVALARSLGTYAYLGTYPHSECLIHCSRNTNRYRA
ncbi:MAG TPA: hypothetical protein VIK00_03545, partial [Candidatus Limnocylindrales bacterium]